MNEHTPAQSGKGIIILRIAVGLMVGISALIIAIVGGMYASTPSSIRQPAATHFHFRLNLIVDGKSVDFAQDQYQTDYRSDICSAALTAQPIHFHDHTNQFVHIHWAGITGGILLKDYGWNVIGGAPQVLGWRFDQGLMHLTSVPIHGPVLPPRPVGAHYYVYVGDAKHFELRSWESFIHEPLPTFFHTTVDAHEHGSTIDASATQADLAQLNHVLGSIVLFVQPEKPTDAQIRAQFEKLAPLPQSQCAG